MFFQSAYKQFYFTEVALLKVHKDIVLNIDTVKVTAVTLLDLYGAFDTIDYSVLLDPFSDWCGISGTVLTWIRSFLINKKMFFKGAFVLRCFTWPYSWTATVYSV